MTILKYCHFLFVISCYRVAIVCSELIFLSGLPLDAMIYENPLGFQTIFGNGAHLDFSRDMRWRLTKKCVLWDAFFSVK